MTKTGNGPVLPDRFGLLETAVYRTGLQPDIL